jgi:hypothetical protein
MADGQQPATSKSNCELQLSALGVGGGLRRFQKTEGRQNKIKRENDVHLRQLAQKNVRTFFFFVIPFCAFLGVSRQGELGNKLSTFPKQFFRGDFFASFLSVFVVALVKRLSMRGGSKTR